MVESIENHPKIAKMAKKTPHTIRNKSFDLNQLEAACLANVEPVTLGRWGNEENPPPRNPDGTYPARDFGMWMMKYQTRKRGNGPADNFPFAPEPRPVKLTMPDPFRAKSTDKNEVEIRLKEAMALRIEMENQTTAARLVPISEVEPVIAEMIATAKNRLLKLPVALSPLVLGDDDLYSIQQKLRDGVNDALSELSVDWKSTSEE